MNKNYHKPQHNAFTCMQCLVSIAVFLSILLSGGPAAYAGGAKAAPKAPLAVPTISASGATSFCSGGSVTLTAGGGAPYTWSTGATSTSITVSTGGTYSVSNSGGTAYQLVYVYGAPAIAPTINVGGSTSLCAGGSVTLTALTTSGAVSTAAGTGAAGSADGTAGSAGLNRPAQAIAMPNGDIYIIESNGNSIRKLSGGTVSTFAVGFGNPQCIVADSKGNFFVSDDGSKSVKKISPAGVVSTFAGSGVSGNANGTGAAATFASPKGICIDAADNLYVCDPLNNIIRKITSSAVVTTFAALPTLPNFCVSDAAGTLYITGSDGKIYSVSSAGGTATVFSAPSGTINLQGITIDKYNNLYLSDYGSNYLRRITTPGAVVTTLFNNGGGNVDGDYTSAKINGSYGITIDNDGNLLLAEYGNHKIRRVTLATTPLWSTGSTASSITVSTTATVTLQQVNALGCLSTAISVGVMAYSTVPTPYIAASSNTYCAGGSVTLTAAGTVTGAVSTFAGTGTAGFNNGATPTTSAMNLPANIMVSGSDYYIIESGNNTVRKITASGSVSNLGSGFNNAQGIAMDSKGYLYIADFDNHVIRRMDQTGNVTTFAGTVGSKGYTDATGSSARFDSPRGLWIDANDNIFVADFRNYRIRKITSAGVVSTFATVTLPNCLTGDAAGNLYVTSYAYRVFTVTAAGAASVFAGNVLAGSGDGVGTAAYFDQLRGIVRDADGNLYVSDYGNNCIRKISPARVVTTLFANGSGNADGGYSAAKLANPYGLAFDSDGNLLVSEYGNHTVRKITLVSTPLWSTGATTASITVSSPASITLQQVNATGCTSSASSPVVVSAFAAPAITAGGATNFCPGGSVTLTANTIKGSVSTFAGTGTAGYNNGATPTASAMNQPAAIVVSGGDYYVTEATNNTVRKITASGSIINLGSGFINPQGIAMDSKGYLYIGDCNNRVIRRMDRAGVVTTFAGTVGSSGNTDATGTSARFATPKSLWIDVNDNIFVTDPGNNSIRKITSAGVVTTFASISLPSFVTGDAAGNLYVTSDNLRIYTVSGAGIVSLLAGNGSTGSVDNTTGTNASFNLPQGIVRDAAGNLYVSDYGNSRIRKISPSGAVTTLFANGSGNVDGSYTAAKLANPYGIALDLDGNLLVSDYSNHNVRKIILYANPLWSTGATTASITVSSSASITLQQVNTNGCSSAASTATAVTVNALPTTPTITAGGPTTFCSGGSVTLTCSAISGGTYIWSTGATAQAITVTTDLAPTVRTISAAGCTSAASAATTVAVNAVPSTPTISGTAAICAGNSNTLTASALAANEVYLWSTGAATPTIQVSTAGTYTLRKINTVTTCTSAVSNVITTTLNITPTAPAFTDGMAYTGTLAQSSGVYSVAISNKGVKAVGLANSVLIYPTPDAVTGAITLNYNGSGSTYCTFSPDGTKLLVASNTKNRVDIYNSIPTVNNQAPDLVIGQASITGTGSGSSATQLFWPAGLAFSPDGKVLITDQGNNRILIYNSIPTANGTSASLVLGQTTFGISTSGISASKFNGPVGVAVSSAGKVLVSDQLNSRVLIWNTFPTANGQAADYVIGQSTLTANATAITQTGLNFPYGVSISATGKVAIADAPNNRVVIYNSIPAANGVAASNVLGQANFNAYGTGSGSSAMNMPFCVAFTPEGRLMVGEFYNSRLSIFGTAPCQASNLSVGLSASAAGICAGSSVTYTYKVTNPAAYAVPGIIIAAAVPAIFNYSTSATVTGSYSSTNNVWTIPSLAAGATATLTVTANVSAALGNQTVTAYAGIIGTGFTETDFTDNGATADVFINSLPAIPVISAGGAIALCTGGSVSLSTTYVLQANEAYLWSNGATTSSVSVNTSGSYTLQIRNTSTLCTSAASAAIAVTVNPLPAQPTITGTAAICLGKINTLTSSATAANEVYLWSTGATTQTIQVSTAGTYTVQKINTVTACTSAVSAGFVTTLNTTATAPAFTDGMAYAGTLARSGVYSIAISSKGVKALGTSSGVLIYPTPDATTGAITLTYSSITYCAFSPDGTKLLVSSGGSNRVDIYNTIPTVNNQAPDLVIGQTDIAGTGSGTSATQMTTPGALAVSPDGRLLICERGNSRVLIYNSIPTANGASADMVLGQTDFSSYVGGLSASKFFTPYGIAVSAAGKVLLADQFNRVLIWNTFPTANGQAADYVIGQSTFTANTAATTQTGLNTSYGVAISATGKVAIADALNNRVLIYNSIPAANGVAASNVLGQALFTTSSTGSGSSAMNKPYCVAFTPEGRLMVGENGNNRVTTFGTAPCQASNLSVGLSASAASLCAGSSVTYTYTVTNPAAYAVPGTIIAAAVPAIFNYSSSATLTGSYSNTENTWTIPDLAAGATATLTVTATVPLTVGNQTVTAYAGIIGTGFTETGFSDNGSSATVTANASVVPAQPAITPVGPADFCAGGSITLTSSLSTGTYLWSTGETTQSITVSTAGNRTVQTINAAGCISEASVVKTVTVIPAPTAPAITGVSGICAGETATLSTDYVLQVNEAYLWSNGSAASSVSLGTAGSYSLRIHNTVTLCTSAVSNVIPIAVYTTPAAPGISTGMAYTSKITSLPIVRSIIISSKGVKAVGAAGLVNLYSSPDATTPYLTLSRTGGGTISCAFSPDGSKMLITEGNFNRVSIYNTLPTAGNQEPDLVIGQTNINNSSSGTTASTLNAPRKVYVLPDGKVIIADAGNHRVLVYNCIPTANGAAADLVLGQPDFVTGTSGLSSTKMTGPQGIAYSADGSLLIAEGENRRITVWNTFPAANGQAADVVIGQPDFTTNTAAITASKFSNPTGIAVSPEGKLAMTDLTGNRALLYNSIPAVNGALANIVLGQRDFISNSLYLGTTVNMVNVFGVCFTTEGRVIVGDGGNGRICTFGVPPCQQSNISVAVSASVSSLCAGTGGSVVYTFTATNPGAYAVPKVYIGAGIPGTFNYSSSTASVGSYSPAGSTWTIPSLAAGATATLTVTAYVSSTLAAQTATAYASVTGIGFTETDFTDNGASVAVSINAVPAQPAITASGTVALCTGSSVVLTASAISGGSYLWSTGATTQSITVSAALSPTVQTISAAGCTSAASVATTVTVIPLPSAPSVSAGSATAFCSGGSVTLTSSAISGGSYIWSTGATTQAITVNTTLSPTVRTVNAQGCTSAASTAVAVTVNSALTAPTVSASRNTALCLGESVTLAAPGPNFNVLAGVGYGYVDGQGAEAAFDWPTGMAIDAAGNIFVSEPYINRIRKITPSGYVSTFAGNGNRGHADGNVTQAEFDNPAGLTFDAAGNLYVANWQSGIINKITPAGQVSTLPGVYSRPYGLALDAAGNLFISEQIGGTISKLTPAGNISIFAGSGNDGFANGTGTAAEFKEPSGMVFDASGNLYVADSRNNAIRIINPAGVVSTFAGNGLSGTADGNDSSASFSYPQGITIDSRGNFYVADVNNVSIRKITPAGKVSTVGSAARPLTYSGPNSESPITYPSDVAIDPSGELVIVENNNNRIFTTTGVSTAYHWNNGENTDTINANTTGNYTLQTITLQGCTSLASPVISVRVTSAAEPVLAVGLVSGANPACIGTPLTFSAAVSDSGSNTAYQWTRNGVNIAGATSAAYTALAGAQLTDGDVINCKFTGQNCNGATAATGTAFSLRTNLTGTWLGNTDAWSNAANWCGGIPTATTDVVLPAGMNTTPNITLGTAVCRDISLSAGTSLPLASGGKLTVYGNVSGEGRLAGAQGSIIEIAGSTQQTLHGGKAGSIRLNNPAGLVLSFATEVTDAIVLVSGNIDATNYPLILSAGAANPVESSAGRIQGRVTARGRATGTGTLSMLGVSIAAGTDDIDTVYIERRDETATYLSNTGIAQVWSIRAGHQPVSGRTVTLSWLPSRSNYKSLAAAQVWRRPEADTRWLKVGNLQSIANASLSPAISVSTNSFSDWTVSDTDNPLPVTWLSFTGKRQALTNQLRWSTASEQENKGFVVQRSLNGIQFDSIDFVPGNGTTTRVNNYSYTDLYAESAYYRLNQIDQNGQSSLSNVIFINGGKANVVPELYPNPGSSYVYITGISETAQVQLISAEGKVLQVLSTDKNQGIYIGNLSSGMYTYKVVTASGVYIGKLVKE